MRHGARSARWHASYGSGAALVLVSLSVAGCIDNLSVGLSPSLSLRDAGEEMPGDDDGTGDDGTGDDTTEDGGSVRVDAGKVPLDASRDAATDAMTDAWSPEGGRDAATAPDAGRDAGLRRCVPDFCTIAGITPADFTCTKPTVKECLRDEETDQCSWHCI